MANTGISTKLLHYFQGNQNRPVTIDELVAAFPEYERRQIMSNVANLRQTKVGRDIDVLKTGVYHYMPQKERSANEVTFHVIKELQNGGYVLMDANEGIYRADRLA